MPAMGLSRDDGLGHGLGEVGEVVGRVELVGADVDDLVSEGLDEPLQLVLQTISAVVCSYGDAHVCFSPCGIVG